MTEILSFARKGLSYIAYQFTRCAPTGSMREFGIKRIKYIMVGQNCYIGPNITITPLGGRYHAPNDNTGKLLVIGDRVTLSPNVTLLCSMHPEKSRLSKMYGKIERITIEDDVWVGAGAIILAGVRLHRCSVVGAGAVVTKDVPPNTVVVGVPARPLKTIDMIE